MASDSVNVHLLLTEHAYKTKVLLMSVGMQLGEWKILIDTFRTSIHGTKITLCDLFQLLYLGLAKLAFFLLNVTLLYFLAFCSHSFRMWLIKIKDHLS